jgi:hypothetical protein
VTLAARLGIEALAQRFVRLGERVGEAHAGRKVMTLIYAMALGADCIDDCELLRSGRLSALLGSAAPHPRRGGYTIRSSMRTRTVSPASFPIALRSFALTGSLCVPSPCAISAPSNGSPSIAPRIFTSPRVPNSSAASSITTHVHAPGLSPF